MKWSDEERRAAGHTRRNENKDGGGRNRKITEKKIKRIKIYKMGKKIERLGITEAECLF